MLLDADIGVTTHRDHIETDFSFRTRVLDYLWTATPIVTTGGDVFGDLVEREQLGEVVPPEDVEALAAALERLLARSRTTPPPAGTNIEALRPTLTWSEALEPLRRVLRRAPPGRRPRSTPIGSATSCSGKGVRPRGLRGLVYDARLARQMVAEGGLRQLASRAWGRVRRLADARLRATPTEPSRPSSARPVEEGGGGLAGHAVARPEACRRCTRW